MKVMTPLLPAVFLFGLSFGVLARTAGMGAVAPIVMSMTTFAGSAQFAVASILDEAGGAVAAILAALFLNARYAPMSIAAGPAFSGPRWRRFFEAQFIVDESWALAARDGGRFEKRVLLGAGLTLFPFWVGGTAAGVLSGELVGDPGRLGMDAAFPALFLALLVSQVRSRQGVAAALAGGAIALALIPVLPAGLPIVVASVACLAGLRR